MGSYVPSTEKQRQEMLEVAGFKDFDDLFFQIPREVLIKGGLNIPSGKSEMEVRRMMESIGDKNIVFKSIFRGAGSYNHYIPSIVKSVTGKETFVTSYTPYQPEVSQGILQSIFEYQTMICELTGMDASNASVYDGASAAAEAAAMCFDKKRKKVLVSETSHPDVIETICTYSWAAGNEVVLIPKKEGVTDLEALSSLLDEESACIYIQQPNFNGLLENCQEAGEIAKAKGAKFIMGIHPLAASVLKTPGECGADIAVGEGQPLGMSMAFGGPYLGFMTATSKMMRKLPGRIAGETVDQKGNRAYVLTLQAREQHIRREKASSNVCSNQALCAMTAAVYMAAMGEHGMKEAALQCMSKARYLAEKLEKLGLKRVYEGEYFNEFITSCDKKEELLMHLEKNGVLGGLPVEEGILWCTTEMNTKEEMDRLIELAGEVLEA